MSFSKKSNPHTELCRAVLLKFGASPHWRIWLNNVGSAKVSGGFVSFGLPGSTDIIGFDRLGRFIALEVKTGDAVLNKNQRGFHKACMLYNVNYALVRSLEDAEKFFQKIENSFPASPA